MATKPLKVPRSCARSRRGNCGKALERTVLRLHPEILEQLDDAASFASLALEREVTRSALIRAAVNGWLKALESTDPTQIVAMLRAARAARRRKPR